MTLHYFIAMNFELEREVKLKVNLTPEEIKTKYGDNLKPEVEGKLYDVLSSLFNNLVGIKKIIVPGEFKSHRGSKAISCSVKAAEGYFFPLKSSLVFIHKPVIYIRHSELKHVEFSRLGARTFDLTLTKLKEEPNVVFLSIERDEYPILVEYFKAAGVKMKSVDEQGHKQELKQTALKTKQDQDMQAFDDDDEDSEDESFNDSGEDDDDDEEEEDEKEVSKDVDMIDEELDKKELKALQKETGDIDLKGGRPKRTGRK